MSDDRFCDRCEIDRGLHPTGDCTPDDCAAAEAREQLMNRFWSVAVGAAPTPTDPENDPR